MNKIFLKAHMYIAIFFLPFALAFIVSGIGYVVGIKELSKVESSIITSYDPPMEALAMVAKEKNLGSYRFKGERRLYAKHYALSLKVMPKSKTYNKALANGTNRATNTDATSQGAGATSQASTDKASQPPLVYKITLYKKTALAYLLEFHKGKNLIAKIGVVAFGIALAMMLLSGILMLRAKQLKKLALPLGAGTLVCALAIILPIF